MSDLFDRDKMAVLYAALPEGLHSTLVEMAEEMYLQLVDDADAGTVLGLAQMANVVIGQIDRIAQRCGGAGFYLPRGIASRQQVKLAARDQQIYAEFKGRNLSQLARKYGLTEMRIYQIVERVRQAEQDRRQGKIDFGD